MAFKTIMVTRNGVDYPCKTEEQLKLFLDAGYIEKKKEKANKDKKNK